MKKNQLALTALLLLCSASISAQESQSYTVRGTVTDASSDGKKIYIYRFDDNVRIDSTVIAGNSFTFKGTIGMPRFCRIDVSRQEYFNFIIEGGNITLNTGKPGGQPSGTPMNDEMAAISVMEDSLYTLVKNKREELGALYKDPAEYAKHYNEYSQSTLFPYCEKKSAELFGKHNDDALAEFLIRSPFSLREQSDKWEAVMNLLGPWMKERRTVKQMVAQIENAKKSAEGMPFLDVKGRDIEGNEASLSDYIGKGKYVLVDFWASWCGPCKAEVPNLAKLHNEYKDKGLTVLGLFVWDKEENLKKAVAEGGITWPQIFDADKKAFTLYGISGIPQIILFGPDGTILKRDLREKEMIKTVDEYMSGKTN